MTLSVNSFNRHRLVGRRDGMILPQCAMRIAVREPSLLERRVKLTIHNRGNLDLPGQRRCTRLFQ
jgi:hypothetical protein